VDRVSGKHAVLDQAVPIGFSGRAGSYIDELIVNGAPISPAVWSGAG